VKTRGAFGTGRCLLAAAIPGLALGVMLLIAFVMDDSAILTVPALLLTLGALLLSFLVYGALSGIYAAALYRFATQKQNGCARL
jgi:Family of unknown function (DUF6159)